MHQQSIVQEVCIPSLSRSLCVTHIDILSLPPLLLRSLYLYLSVLRICLRISSSSKTLVSYRAPPLRPSRSIPPPPQPRHIHCPSETSRSEDGQERASGGPCLAVSSLPAPSIHPFPIAEGSQLQSLPRLLRRYLRQCCLPRSTNLHLPRCCTYLFSAMTPVLWPGIPDLLRPVSSVRQFVSQATTAPPVPQTAAAPSHQQPAKDRFPRLSHQATAHTRTSGGRIHSIEFPGSSSSPPTPPS
jgi:hypothetical protein